MLPTEAKIICDLFKELERAEDYIRAITQLSLPGYGTARKNHIRKWSMMRALARKRRAIRKIGKCGIVIADTYVNTKVTIQGLERLEELKKKEKECMEQEGITEVWIGMPGDPWK